MLDTLKQVQSDGLSAIYRILEHTLGRGSLKVGVKS